MKRKDHEHRLDASQLPKGMIADHWTNRGDANEPPRFVVTGWHARESKRAKGRA